MLPLALPLFQLGFSQRASSEVAFLKQMLAPEKYVQVTAIVLQDRQFQHLTSAEMLTVPKQNYLTEQLEAEAPVTSCLRVGEYHVQETTGAVAKQGQLHHVLEAT
jgi:hypothetical protein